MSRLASIEVVEDRTAGSRCDEGFLRVRRLRLRNVYDDGSASAPYACDVVSRRHVDAVAIVLFDREADGSVRVALRLGVRPPVALRPATAHTPAGTHALLLAEIVAGVLEDEDAQAGGVETRAAAECREEAGYAVDPGRIRPLGAPLHPSPGVTDECVFFRAAETDLDVAGTPCGDGSGMEDGLEVVVLPLREAIRRCRAGEVPDMKTEVALLRLCDAIGYLPALDRFVGDLPEPLRDRAAGLDPLIEA